VQREKVAYGFIHTLIRRQLDGHMHEEQKDREKNVWCQRLFTFAACALCSKSSPFRLHASSSCRRIPQGNKHMAGPPE